MTTSAKKKAYDRKYNDTHTRQINLGLSIRYDADILAQLDAVPNKQGYIKELIRADIAKNGPAQKEEEKPMWFIVDDATTAKGRLDVEPTDTEDKPTALTKALHVWNHLTHDERKNRDAFYIALGQTDEDGLLDWNTVTETVKLKDSPTE